MAGELALPAGPVDDPQAPIVSVSRLAGGDERELPIRAGLHAYAHCLRGGPGGVAVLLINTDRAAAQAVTLPSAGERYTLTSRDPLSRAVDLNGSALTLGAGDALPPLKGARFSAGEVTLAPASITFLSVPGAGNPSCR